MKEILSNIVGMYKAMGTILIYMIAGILFVWISFIILSKVLEITFNLTKNFDTLKYNQENKKHMKEIGKSMNKDVRTDIKKCMDKDGKIIREYQIGRREKCADINIDVSKQSHCKSEDNLENLIDVRDEDGIGYTIQKKYLKGDGRIDWYKIRKDIRMEE